MKKLVLALAVMAATLGVVQQAAQAAPAGVRWHATPPDTHDQPAYRFRAARPRAAAIPPFDGPINVNAATVILNHFGNPAAGQVMVETWINAPRSDLGLPIRAIPFARATRALKVKRVSLRVVLHTLNLDGTVDVVLSGPTYNNSTLAGNPIIFNATGPFRLTGGLSTDPVFCEAWTEAFYAVRWADDTLTSGRVLIPPGTWFQDACYVIPTS